MDFLVTKVYATQVDVENTMGVVAGETNITQAMILDAIKDASDEVDLITHTKFHSVEDSGTADTESTTLTLVDATKSATWTANLYENYVLWIYSGTGSGQYSRIASNTTTVLTLTDTLATAPDDTSLYRIIPDVYSSKSMDGNSRIEFFLPEYPVKSLLSLTISGTTVTPSKVYVYENIGKLLLNSHLSPEVSYFSKIYPQGIVAKWIYGVYPIPRSIVELTANISAIKCLISQIGGTYNDVTSYSIPHFTAALGEPYTNIRETLTRLDKETQSMIPRIKKYPVVV